ncbi:hypothetical protein EJ05DRAFT_441428 [Pseudovirgaria hyperparasitica]|uniref:L domain-like protein n=1 Tax=Pseudovirgaria hyperparasitica TaxID=470096 RepID=A0A6A6W366_9PEZI|nr:uncharacterized protein EJ05DRAFT_441428 [Pseudovirgaria hyperparasitica]KAF2756579.1 hypothetical protein EJ05DRAFT_441428 [Pseudovirgaria hyperparasitica]
MDTEDGKIFIKNLAYFVRTHEKALANALLLQRQNPRNVTQASGGSASPSSPPPSASSGGFVSGFPLPYFGSQVIKPAKLTLTPHHLFYLLSRYEELGVAVGPMNVRLENIHTEASPANYVSFLSQAQRKKSRNSDRDSIHSVSSMRSVMSGMSALWSTLGIGPTAEARSEKQKAVEKEDLKYLYSAFTKIPCLRLAPDHKARLIAGYEEFPFDSAVPLHVFKTMSALEICDVDFRQFYGWDRLAEQLKSLTLKRAGIEDPADLLIHIVLDDIDKRRKRSAKIPQSPAQPWPAASPGPRYIDIARSGSTESSPDLSSPKHVPGPSPQNSPMKRGTSTRQRRRSVSPPARPKSSRHDTDTYGRASTPNIRRSSGSSASSLHSETPRGSMSNLLTMGYLPSTKWRFLRHLSLADNGLTAIFATSLTPVMNTLQSLDLSSNLFTEIPDSLASLVSLRALNLSNCMIESLHSLGKSPLPAITTLNLRGNRLGSLAGIERLLSLERLDIRDNKLTDPTEVARLTSCPNMRELYVHKNPFTKTHGNHRVTIFNLFRNTPGYSEDITIDSQGPGYSERKQLVDRAPEPVSVPVVRPPPEDENRPAPKPKPEPAQTRPPPDPVQSSRSTSSHQRTRSDLTYGSQKKRKGPKRRIVELSRNDSLQQSHSELSTITQTSPLPSRPSVTREDYGGTLRSTPTRHKSEPQTASTQLPPLTTVFVPPPVDEIAEQPVKSPPEFDVSNDLYRKKIEALKQDFGNNWLSALGDESWDAKPQQAKYSGGDLSPSVVLRASAGPTRTPSQNIVSSGRTLG